MKFPPMFPKADLEGSSKSVTQLSPDLAVGSFIFAPKLIDQGWHCLVLAKAAPELTEPHRKVYLIDGTGNPLVTIQEAIHYVVDQWEAGHKVAVMCRSGANRAPAIAAASLYVAKRATSVYGAIEWMRGLRSEVGTYGPAASEVEVAAHYMLDIKRRPRT